MICCVSLIEIGFVYYDCVWWVLNDVGEVDVLVIFMQLVLLGLLCILVVIDFGVNYLLFVLSDFLQEFLDIIVNMVLNNWYVELIFEGFDMVICIGELEDLILCVCKLIEIICCMIVVLFYFEEYGCFEKIDDLNEYKLLYYFNQVNSVVWKIIVLSGEKWQVCIVGWLIVNDGQLLLNVCISGLGIVYLLLFFYVDVLCDGLVEEVMLELLVEFQGIYVVYLLGCFIQFKVWVFIDFFVYVFVEKGLEKW